MTNPVLQSEGFEKAVYQFRDSAERLSQTLSDFGYHVDRLQGILETHADAMQRIADTIQAKPY